MKIKDVISILVLFVLGILCLSPIIVNKYYEINTADWIEKDAIIINQNIFQEGTISSKTGKKSKVKYEYSIVYFVDGIKINGMVFSAIKYNDSIKIKYNSQKNEKFFAVEKLKNGLNVELIIIGLLFILFGFLLISKRNKIN